MRSFRKNSSQSSTSRNSGPSLRDIYASIVSLLFLGPSEDCCAISLVPIATADCDPSYVVLDEPELPKESAWRMAYGAARMAVEITEESSDMFLLLKAVTSALSVFTRNYDQTIANAQQMKDIGERVESLSELLTSPVGDQDTGEKARRTALRKTLSGIIVKLEPLSNKRGLEEFLNNVDHANTLNGFVQDLANAVTDYQTSIHQSSGGDEERTNTPTVKERIGREGTTEKADENAQSITVRLSFMRKVGRALAKLGRCSTKRAME